MPNHMDRDAVVVLGNKSLGGPDYLATVLIEVLNSLQQVLVTYAGMLSSSAVMCVPWVLVRSAMHPTQPT